MRIFSLHGFTGCQKDFDQIRLESKGWLEWVPIELPGHGKNNFQIQNFKDGIHWLNRELQINRFSPEDILLGYSMGGRLAASYATLFPMKINKLVLIGTNFGIENWLERFERYRKDAKIAKMVLKQGTIEFLKKWNQNPLLANQASHIPNYETLMKERFRNCPKGLSMCLKALSIGLMPPIWKKLKNIHCPSLLIAGQLDKKFYSINQKALLYAPSNFQAVTIAKAGHAAHLENMNHFLIHLKAFIQ